MTCIYTRSLTKKKNVYENLGPINIDGSEWKPRLIVDSSFPILAQKSVFLDKRCSV